MLQRYAEGAEHLDRATSNVWVEELRSLVRNASSLHRVAEVALRAVAESAEAYRAGLGFAGSAVVAQIRAAAADVLGIADLPHARADQLVRQVGGPPPNP